jgi:4-amino-4-deoxy-L-arabinose transferase-like glycosyltransferase
VSEPAAGLESEGKGDPLRGRTLAGLLGLATGSAALSIVLHPGWTFAKYPNLAAELLRGTLTPAQVGDASPGYLLLHLLLPAQGVRWLQALAAAATVVLAFLVADRVRGRVAAWVAGAALALAGPWLVYGSVLEPDLAIGALDAAAVAFLVVPRGRALLWSALAGASLGLSFALRPSAAVLAVAVLGWLLLDRRVAAGRGRTASALSCAAAFGLCAFLPVAALHARARQEWRSTMSVGQVFHQGHRPESSGLGANYPTLLALAALQSAARPGHAPDLHHELYRRFAGAAEGAPLSAAAAERYWIDRALTFAAREPWAFARQLGRKLVFVFAAPDHDADIPTVEAAGQSARFGGIPMRWLALGGLAGLLLSLRGGRAQRLVVLWVASYLLVYLVFYYQSRYGLAILPAWCVLCGAAVAEAWEARRSGRRLALAAAALGAPLLLLAPGWVRNEGRLLARAALVPAQSQAGSLRAQGRWSEALDRFVEEQAALPDHVWPSSPHGYGLQVDSPAQALRAAERARARFGVGTPTDAYLLAVLYAHAGRCDLALPLARLASESGFHGAIADTSLDPDLLASDCLLAQGDRDGALDGIERSLARWPGTLDGLVRAVAAGEARPGTTGPEVALREAELLALHDPASAHYGLARARRRWGAALRAIADAEWIRLRVPEAAPLADFEQALSYLDLGRSGDALRAYARSLSSGLAMHEADRFDHPVRDLVRSLPDDPAAIRVALAHWSARGDLDEIRALLRRHPGLADGPAPGEVAPRP